MTYETNQFDITFDCSNCGAEFVRTYGAGTLVESKVGSGVRIDVCDALGCFEDDCGDCGRLTCPVCELTEHIGVLNREPKTIDNTTDD